MNTREKTLLFILVFFVLAGVLGFGGYRFVYAPYEAKQALARSLQESADKKEAELKALKEAQANMALYRAMSLPSNADYARSEYGKYLRDMLRKNGFVEPVNTVTISAADDKDQNKKPIAGASKKEPPYSIVNARVIAEGPMENVEKILEEFYRAPLLHQIKEIAVDRPLTSTAKGHERDVKLSLTIQALIVTGVEKRNYLIREVDPNLLAIDTVAALRREPLGFGMALDVISPAGRINGPYRLHGMPNDPKRDYSAIAYKNVFYGKPPVIVAGDKKPDKVVDPSKDGTPQLMPTRFVRLNHIYSGTRVETHLYDVLNDRLYKPRASIGFNTFPFIKDGNSRSVVLGTVVKIDDDDRDLYFRVDLSAEDPPGNDDFYFYKVDKKELDKFVTDKVITKEERARTLRVHRDYWDTLVRTQVIRLREKDTFRVELRADGARTSSGEDALPPNEILKGKIVKSNDYELWIVTDERYYQIHMGWTVEDALDKKPLPPEKIKSLELKGPN